MTSRVLSLKSIETAVLGIVAFALSGALVRLLSSGSEDLVMNGDPRFEIALGLFYACILLIFLFHLAPGIRTTFYTPAIPALIFFTFLSALWAEMPGLVLRRAVGVGGATLFGVVLASRLTIDEQLILLRRVFRVCAALCVIAWVLGHVLGMHLVTGSTGGVLNSDGAGPWRGIFNHKNMLGSAMALGILVEWHIPVEAVAARVWKTAWLCLFAALLLLSNSITSVASLVLTLAVMYAAKSFRGRYGMVLPAFLVVLLFAGILVFLNAEPVMAALGRSADLTGRADLWRWTVIMIQNRPLTGYGFSGFWRGASEHSRTVETHIAWSPIYAHNGYLEILLSVGLIGFLLFAWMASTGLWRAVRMSKAAECIQDLWPLAFLVFFLIHNMAEVTILWQNCLEWGLCVATVVSADPRLRASLEPAWEEFSPDSLAEYA